jgi:hypothetical protein
MQDVLQLALEDPEVSELFEGVAAGSKVKITLDITVSEIDEERIHGTVDSVHDDLTVIESSEDLELDEEPDEEPVEDEEEDYEE